MLSKEVPLLYSSNRMDDVLEFLEKGQDYIKKITEDRKRFTSEEITYRTLNHWTKLRLIDDARPNGKGWRKFSFVEVVWMKVISELRSFGFPNDKILSVKSSLQNFLREEEKIENSVALQYYIGIAQIKKESSFILAFDSGKAAFATYDDLSYSEMLRSTPNHIRVSLNEILGEILPIGNFAPKNDSQFKLTKEEASLLYEIRVNQVKSITVKSSDGQISQMDIEDKIGPKTSLSELLSEYDYQDITLKKREGKIVSIERTQKKKVTKN